MRRIHICLRWCARYIRWQIAQPRRIHFRSVDDWIIARMRWEASKPRREGEERDTAHEEYRSMI